MNSELDFGENADMQRGKRCLLYIFIALIKIKEKGKCSWSNLVNIVVKSENSTIVGNLALFGGIKSFASRNSTNQAYAFVNSTASKI